MLVNLAILISGLISGNIIFQTAVVAPSVFKTLSLKEASPFLRSIFPKLFFTNAFLGLTLLFLTLFIDIFVLYVVSSITFANMLLCYYLVPFTNRARDSDNQSRFKKLHTISVVLTIIVLLINLSWVFLI